MAFFFVGGVVAVEAAASVNSAFCNFAFDNFTFFDDLTVVVVGAVANESIAFDDSTFDEFFIFFLFICGMDGEDKDGDCDGGATVVWDDDAFADLLDLVRGAGDSGSCFFFGPFFAFAFAFVDAMIT